MNRAILVALGTGTAITSAAAIGIGAALSPPASKLSRTEYESTLAKIRVVQAARLAPCETLDAAQREICRAQAGAEELVKVADLERSFRGTPDAAREAQRARIEARYQVARARCAAVKGYDHDQCLIAAHAARGVALLEGQAPYEMRPS